jgi:multicomponent Na+:H+ antiporter subunit G
LDVNIAHFLEIGLLAVCGAAALMSSIGILMVRDFYERLHYMGPAGSVGTVAIAGALLLKEPFTSAGMKVILVAVLLVISNSVLTHATARAGRVHQIGDWKPKRGEDIVMESASEPARSRASKRKSRKHRRKNSEE